MRTTRRFAAPPAALAAALFAAASAGPPGAALAFPGTAFPGGPAAEYGPEAETAFRSGCAEAGESPARCTCLLARLEASLGYEALLGVAGCSLAGLAASADPQLSDALREAGAACGNATVARSRPD